MPKLLVSVQENRYMGMNTYTGRVKVYDSDMYLYAHSAGIKRTTKEDALADANWLRDDLLNQ